MADAVSKRALMLAFGSWLAGLRDSTNSGSQEEAARKIGVSRGQLARWETGKSFPHVGNIQGIADAYRVEVSEIHKRMGNGEYRPGLSEWASSLARDIDMRTAGLTPDQRQNVERAIRSVLTVAGGP